MASRACGYVLKQSTGSRANFCPPRFYACQRDPDVHGSHNTLKIASTNIQENWKKEQEDLVESKRRDIDKEEAFLQRQLRAETIKRANDKLYEQTGKMKLLRSNLLYAEVIEVRVIVEKRCVTGTVLLPLQAALVK